MKEYSYLISVLLCCIHTTSASDFVNRAFGHQTDILPAAFGDFNSDELTDLFVIEKNNRNVTILLASPKEPFFYHSGLYCELPAGYAVTSVIPGDFDGDALMDFLVTAINLEDKRPAQKTYVFINWGNLNRVNCSKRYAFEMLEEPLILDYDQNLIADLFGRKNDTTNVFWIFSNNRSEPIREIPLVMPENKKLVMRKPHSHAFIDMNNDNAPDLFLTTEDGFATWCYDEKDEDFIYDPRYQMPYPEDREKYTVRIVPFISFLISVIIFEKSDSKTCEVYFGSEK